MTMTTKIKATRKQRTTNMGMHNSVEHRLEPEKSEARQVLKRLLAAHEAYFDVQQNYTWHDRTFDGYAFFKEEAQGYVLSKKAKLWGAEVYEHIFFLCVEHLTEDLLADTIQFIQTNGPDKVEKSPDHMTTYLSLVVIAESADENAARMTKKTHFRKNFLFGLRGWCDLRVAVIDLSNHVIFTNTRGKEMAKTLSDCAFPERSQKNS